MAATTNEDAFRAIIERGFNNGDLDALDALIAPDAVEHQPHAPDVPTVGPAAVKTIVEVLRRAFPDLTLSIEETAAVGDMVWARIRSSGTNDGPFMGNPPTHRRMTIDTMELGRFEDGRMVEHWGVADRLGALVQLGLTPGGRRQAAS